MSAKKERELRKGIEVCQMLMERQDEIVEVHDALTETLGNHKKSIETACKLLITTVDRVDKLEEWRKDHILQDMLRRNREKREAELRVQLEMDRKKHVRRIRKAFGWTSVLCYLLMLGLTGGLECGTIPFGAAVPLMILTACGGFVFACKAGLMVWEYQ